MPTISGHVYYNANNTLTPGVGIPNVPVVLYRPSDTVGMIALTDPSGAFVFNNVSNGAYQIIEAWGALGGMPSPVDFSAALPMATLPPEAEPPVSALPVAPSPLADFLMAISPNLLNVTVSGSDLANLFFYDAPIGSKPITFNGVNFIGPNLITAADNGTFGTVAPGSPVNTIPPLPPYPTATPGLPYQAGPEITDGHYSINNIRNVVNPAWNWWNLSDHETMLETGRFMYVNGDLPGAILFEQTVTVTPDTYYVMTGWVMNLLNVAGVPPRFSFKVIGSDGSQLGYDLLNSLGQTEIPVWYQNGFLFNSAAFSSVTVQVISEAPFSTTGNDYVIDELRMYEAEITDLIALQKSMVPSTIYSDTSGAGQDVLVTVTVNNTSSQVVNNLVFQDIIDPQLQFVPGTVTVNGSGIGYETADPNVPFAIGNLPLTPATVVQFHVTTMVPGPVTIPNTANVAYDVAESGNGDIIKHTTYSNQADVQIIINKATLNIIKTADKQFAKVGDTITYTITYTNTGNVPATNVSLTDTVPTVIGISYVNGSLTVSGATFNGDPFSGINLTSAIAPGATVKVTFQIKVNALPAPNPIPNTASATYNYTIDPANPNTGSGENSSGTVTTLVSQANVTITKSVDPTVAAFGDVLTYTLVLHNSGNVAANNVVIVDPVPGGTTYLPGSLIGANGAPPSMTLAAPLAAGGTTTVIYQVTVGNIIPNPNPIPNTADVNFKYTVNPLDPNGQSGTSTSNTVETNLTTPSLIVTKTVDKAIAHPGDVITYTLNIQNIGNLPANQVTIVDPIPNGLSYNAGSISGTVLFSGDPTTSILLSAPILPGGTASITFQTTVIFIPSGNQAFNSATVNCLFTKDPAHPDGASLTARSNTVKTCLHLYNFMQATTDLVESVALEETGISHILNAEGEKIQAALAMQNATPDQLLAVNQSVMDMVNAISKLETILQSKIDIVKTQIFCR